MSPADIIFIGAIVADIVALVHEFQASGKDLLGWAVVVLCTAIVIAHFA